MPTNTFILNVSCLQLNEHCKNLKRTHLLWVETISKHESTNSHPTLLTLLEAMDVLKVNSQICIAVV